jgi:hypothetical protein
MRVFSSLITSDFGFSSAIESETGTQPFEFRNLEAVVLEGNQLVHWFRSGDFFMTKESRPWLRAQVITTDATGPGCIIQSDYPKDAVHGNFEVVVLEGKRLVHYWHDNSDVENLWQRAHVITADATGPGCIIQSDFPKDADHKNFEVVVLEGNQLVHYWHDNSDAGGPWQRGQVITNAATGPGCIIQSDSART